MTAEQILIAQLMVQLIARGTHQSSAYETAKEIVDYAKKYKS